MPRDSQGNGHTETVLVLDIRGDSVGLALVNYGFEPEVLPEVLYFVRKEFTLSNIRAAGKKRTQELMKALEELLETLDKKAVRQIDLMYCTYAAPWVLSQARTSVVEQDHPFEVTTRLIEQLHNKEKQAFYGEVKEFGMEKVQRMEMLEDFASQYRLNGYPIISPIGNQVGSFEATFQFSSVSTVLKNQVMQLLRKYRPVPIVQHSFYYALLSASVALRGNQDNFLVIDVSDTMTEMGVVHNAVPVASFSFPLGYMTIKAELATKTKQTPAQLEETSKLKQRGVLDKKTGDKHHKLMKKGGTAWLKAVSETLRNLSATTMVPEKVFLVTKPHHQELFTELYLDERCQRFYTAGQKCTIQAIPASIFVDALTLGEEATTDAVMAVIIDFFQVMRSQYVYNGVNHALA